MASPARSTYPAVTCSWSRLARASVISTSGSTGVSGGPDVSVDGGVVHGRHLRPQPRGHHLVELGQRAQRRLAHARDAAARRYPQADRHRDGLVRVEQQRWQRRARAQLVAAAVTLAGVHRVAEVAQAVDVAAHAAAGDAEPLGELLARPHPAGLQQPEQLQHAARRFGHVHSLPHS